MRRLFGLLAILALLALTVRVFAAPFPDLPRDHWAYDAVAKLANKGILEGYPDGLYRGDRAASRYEMAMALARTVAKIEDLANSLPDFSIFVTKDDLEVLRRLMYEFRDELDALGIRVSNLEERVANLERRLEVLEKVTFEGSYKYAYSDAYLDVDEPNDKPQVVDPMLPFTTYKFYNIKADYKPFTGDLFQTYMWGYYYTTYQDSYDLATLKVNAKVGDWRAHLTMKGSSSGGYKSWYSPNFGYSNYSGTPYGIPGGFYGNPETTGLLTGINIYFDRIELVNSKNDITVEVGSFRPSLIGDFMFAGVPRTYYWRDEWGYFNPLWGWKISGGRETNSALGNIEYEIWYGKLVNNFATYGYNTSEDNYYTTDEDQVAVSASAKFNFKNGWVTLSYLKVYDTAQDLGHPWPWMAQEQYTWGIEFSYMFPHDVEFGAKYAVSTYYENKLDESTKIDDDNSVVDVYVKGYFGNNKQGHWKAEYVSTEPYYQPYVGIMPYDNIQIYGYFPLPGYGYGGYGSRGTYTIHNSRLYLNNAEGFRVFLDYKFNENFKGWLAYESYNEVKGKSYDMSVWNAGFNYKFSEKFDMTANYVGINYDPEDSDDIDQSYYDVAFRYFQNQKTTWLLGYTGYNYDDPDYDFDAYHIYLGVNYQPNKDLKFFAVYRFIDYNDAPIFEGNNISSTSPVQKDANGYHLWVGVQFKYGQK